jgi:hypothetical protein
MAFSFDFILSVEKLTRPAREATEALGAMVAALKDARGALDNVDGALGKSRGGWSSVTRAVKETQSAHRSESTNLRKIADDWQKMAAQAEKAEQRKTAAAAREASRREQAMLKEAAAAEKAAERKVKAEQKAERDLERARKKAEREAERAARKAEREARSPLFGGYSSVSGLLRGTASQKASGMARGAASALLGAPGALVGGALDLAGSAVGFGADLASAAADAAVSFGKMAISAQAMREQSVEGFKAIFGSAEISEKLFDNAVRIAKLTKFDTPEVVQHFNNLAAGGFKADELTTVFAGIADVQSARGGGFASRYSNALQKLNAQPSAMFSTFQQAAMAGPGLKLSEEVLAKQLGLKPGANIDAELRKMFREKKISGTGAINAVLTATSQRYDQGGDLGGFARKQGEGTWEGLISNIRNGLSDVLTMKLPANHPMMRFKGILVEVNRLFDDTTEGGKRFQALVSRLVSDVFTLFDMKDGNTSKFIDKLLTGAEKLESWFAKLATWAKEALDDMFNADDIMGVLSVPFEKLGQTIAIGALDALEAAGVPGFKGAAEEARTAYKQRAELVKTGMTKDEAEAVAQFEETARNSPAFGRSALLARADAIRAEAQARLQKKKAKDTGSSMVDGLAVGIYENSPKLERAAGYAGQIPIDIVRSVTDTHSPSREFEKIGKGWMDGTILGVEKNQDRLRRTMDNSVPGLNMGGGGQVIINNHFDTSSISDSSELATIVIDQMMRQIGGHVRAPTAKSIR